MNRIFQVVEGGAAGLSEIYEKHKKDKLVDKNIVYLADNYVDMARSAYMGILFMLPTKLPCVGERWVIQTAENFDDLIKKLDNY